MNSESYLRAVARVLEDMPRDDIDRLVEELEKAWRRDATVFLLGNGGSAAAAAHLACDLGKGTASPGHRRLRVISLVDNVPLISAWANDTSYERVFVEQLAGLVRPGDLVIAISGSGNSPNVLRAVEHAAAMGAVTAGLTGFQGGRLAGMVDLAVIVPDDCMERIEDAHLVIGHAAAVALRERVRRAPVFRPAVFLDRDGVINALGPGDGYVTRWEQFQFLPGALEALAELARHDLPVVIVTNQSIIGRGLASYEEVRTIHRLMEERIRDAGGRVAAVYVCPHRPEDGCGCRKPRPGLFFLARDDLGLDLARSVVIGDHQSDMEAAARIGATGILVKTGHGVTWAREGAGDVVVVENLPAAVQRILTHNTNAYVNDDAHEEGGCDAEGLSFH
ncbi:HAD-IIIA family hydrolase [Candidatus Fermentibacteria bacterium]|nr:HAD-IIIA family hydrolase [Candidatus Fermentibacteria bacterium]